MPGVAGSFSLNKIAEKVHIAARIRYKAQDLTKEEQTAGIDIVQKIGALYERTDEQISKTNFLTQLFFFIWESLFNLSVSFDCLYTMRWNICEGGVTRNCFL